MRLRSALGPLIMLLGVIGLGTIALIEAQLGDAPTAIVCAILALVVVQLGRE